jgi:hypothetical protein
VFALSREKLGPRHHLGVLLEERAALPLGHPAPNAELNAVIQRICAAFHDDRTVPTNHGRFALCGAADEKFIGISGATASL